MSSVAIITARGGSKRIPGKNKKIFAGKPILAYSIEAALGSGVFDEVMVSTDDDEIAKIAEEYGACVPFRRSEATANDYATTADVLTEVLDCYDKLGKHFDEFACIYPTAPFVTDNRLKDAFMKLHESGAKSLVSVTKYDFPPQRSVVIRDGLMQFREPQYATARSQDLEPVYHDAGQFYLCRTDAFRAQKTLVTDCTTAYILPIEEVQDIDTPDDWMIAEIKFEMLKKKT